MRRALAFCAAVAALLACTSVKKDVLTDRYAARPLPTEQVQVFYADDSIPECERVALLYARSDKSVSESKTIEAVREEAGKLGANAVVINEVREPSLAEGVLDAALAGMFRTNQYPQKRTAQALAIYCASLDR